MTEGSGDPGLAGLLTVEPGMSPDEALQRLRVNALAVHQRSIGRSDELVRILERTVAQVEKTHNRVKLMSTLLFLAGVALLAAAAAAVLAGQQELWAVAVGGVGGLAALAAVFWTAPLNTIATSISDLVKLEVAFLGYIRVIGEIDSFFQMRYLDILAEPSNDEDKRALTNAILDTKNQMKDMMSHTVELLDGYLSLPSESMNELKRALGEATQRIQKLEASASQPTSSE